MLDMGNLPPSSNTATVPTFDLADRLRKTLRHSGTGVQAIADELGVSRFTVSNYLAGRTTPTPEALTTWAHRTGVSLEWLQGEPCD